jgi:hypothetical protein
MNEIEQDIKGAEKYIIGEGIKSYIKKIDEELESIEIKRKYSSSKITYHQLIEFYVSFYQIQACYNLIKKHAVELGNYKYDLDDIRRKARSLKKLLREDFQRENSPKYDKNMVYQRLIEFYK